ncbi:MAG: pimeloyl-ACP methyl ester esterase BioH [Gammaproteobacteria bacterium]|jgi:pimeloyl-[acyl-carrier protein] methyl ester esterase|nr:pimeloyl-ACP methyl ester esterase BioH [Gammaproteobacteria bacterium]
MSLYTQTSGTGPALILIHGWSLHGGIWEQLVPLLEPHFRVTCVDLPGHGRSDWRGEETLDAMVDAVLSVAPAEAAWLGWSLGGLVAARAALMAPARVSALVEMASTPCFVRKPGWQSAMLPALLDTFAAELAEDYVRTLNRFLALQVRGSDGASEVLKTLRALMLVHGEPNPEGLRAGLEVLRTADLRDSLGRIDCPALLLMGERDTLVPVNAGQAACELFPAAQLQVVAGAGHAPFIAQPEMVAGLITGFLCEDVAQGC